MRPRDVAIEPPCPVCGSSKHRFAKLCKRCKRLVGRLDTRHKADRDARVRALKAAWDGDGFCCYYTGVRLVEDNHADPRYLTFDHRVPRREDDVVVAAASLNDMKSDLDETEFRAVVLELAKRFQGGSFDAKVLELKHWKR